MILKINPDERPKIQDILSKLNALDSEADVLAKEKGARLDLEEDSGLNGVQLGQVAHESSAALEEVKSECEVFSEEQYSRSV